jgi:hypothetical protein
MPDEEQAEPTEPTDDHADEATPEQSAGRVFSPYGVASAVLGLLCVAAIALGVVIWSSHRSDVQERSYQSRALQAAADWTGLLINMNTDNIKESLQRLHDGTVGQLNADFDSSIPRPAAPRRLSNCRPRSPAAPTRSWWWPPRSVKTPVASRKPCIGTCGWGSPTWTAS